MKIKSVDVNSGTYIDYGVKHNEKDCKFKFSDQVRILKYRNFFAEGCTPNWSEEFFCDQKSKKYCAMDIQY